MTAVSTKKTDFFIAGNSKSGTTALYKFLGKHPSICMSNPKEPNFFAKDFCHNQPVGAFTRKSEQEYINCFKDPAQEKLWGEASACYMYSKVAAREIFDYNPEAKIILMLREPVDFLHSYHLQMLKNPVSEGETEKSFRKALALEEDRKRGKNIPDGCLIPELLLYSERVKYAEQVNRFMRLFGREQVKTIIYDDFEADNSAVYQDVLEFLCVDESFEPQFKRYNKGEKLKSKSMQRLMHKLTHGKGFFSYVKPVIKQIMPRSARHFLLGRVYRNVVFRPKTDVEPALRLELKKRFKGEVEKLSRLLDRDLVALWDYDNLSHDRQEIVGAEDDAGEKELLS